MLRREILAGFCVGIFMDFDDEVDLAYEILQAEVVKHRAQGIAIVRQAEGDGYFNAFAFLDRDGGFLNMPMMLPVLGAASANRREARRFLVRLTDNFDWGPLVDGLRQRGLNVLHFEYWDGP